MDARVLVVPPPPIQGVGNASGATMQLELRDGSFDFRKLQSLANQMVEAGSSQSSFQRLLTTFRADAPQFRIDVDRVKAQTLHVNVDQVFSTIQTFMGSTYVVQFNKFGRTFQAYVQADAKFRLRPEDITDLSVRNAQGQNVPIGTLASIEPTTGPPLISLYNLYPTATVIGIPVQGVSSGQAMALMEQIASRMPPGTGYEWTALSYQEKLVGNQSIWCSGSASCSSIWCSPGNTSWYAPLAIVLGPLALRSVRHRPCWPLVDANLYVSRPDLLKSRSRRRTS
jgi:HAE1 family hydrophobic/amphiphilic exporter-1